MRTETGGGVIFACSGVEPREGQTPVVVGSSSELGGWDVSRGITLHRVKNPAFPGVWMSFPMFHSASSQVQFLFALVGPSASFSPVGGLVTSADGESLVDGVQNSSAVPSALAAAAAAPTDGRGQDCCGFVWEPLGCGVREVGVVDGGLVLFSGRWGEGGTQVTPLTWEDMVLAQQQLEQDSLPSVSGNEKEKERGETEGSFEGIQKGEASGGESFGGPPEGDMMVAVPTAETVSFPVSSVPSALSPSSPAFASSQRGGGNRGGQRRGFSQPVQCEAEFLARRSSLRASGRQGVGGGGGEVLLREIGVASVATDSARFEGLSVRGGRPETSVSVPVRKRGYETMEGGGRDGVSDQALRFAPAVLKRRGGVTGEEGGVSGGKVAESVHGLTGGYDSVSVPSLLVRESESACRARLAEDQSVSVGCEGPKRRRLSSPSVLVSESQSGRGGSHEGESAGRGEEGRDRNFQRAGLCLHGRRLTHCRECGGAQGCQGGQWHKCTATSGTVRVDQQQVCGDGSGRHIGMRRAEKGRSRGIDEETFSVRMDGFVVSARSVEVVAFVSTVDGARSARIAGGKVFVSTAGSGTTAKSVEGRVFVSTAVSVTEAKIAEGRVSVSMAVSVTDAKIAEGRVSVSMAGGALSARSVEGRVCVSTAVSVADAKSVEEVAFVSTVDGATITGTVGGKASVSTAGSARSARSAQGRAFVFIEKILNTATSASLFFPLTPPPEDAPCPHLCFFSLSWFSFCVFLEKCLSCPFLSCLQGSR
uniref:CBM20 domain-containing protein n=1 Tax=Chromera velia CCMP2878 TaxID=1169474 RepID=A0A0G4I709_9ALVE|eukprot:Cvel_11541.t1-p1 / transcript=Cvel_11541.t1 / gene=Cvel_11541 / organism=Chromera_velia_CCMP2878 / gene_product=Zinc finger protein 283, putative / transcript_product=Zinc finger protein 283, putative / location=Cvel_scaffold729:632-2917(+) / protein_length=762 / sequence_SO=supercontig / SO=protein_coding / is_pseudo=false